MHLDNDMFTDAACSGKQQQQEAEEDKEVEEGEEETRNVGFEPGDCDAGIDACGVRAHALSEWRLEPPP